MYYLIYVSSATREMSNEELAEILDTARKENAKASITGMLLYKEGNFMQMLEGEKERVLDLYEKIKKDPRHKDVITVIEREAPKRTFPDWTMGFHNMQQIKGNPNFNDYISINLIPERFLGDARFAHSFISSFNQTDDQLTS